MATLQLAFYLVVLTVLAKPLGGYMARVYEGQELRSRPRAWRLERQLYRVCGIRPHEEMAWKTYAAAMLAFNFVGLLAVYAPATFAGLPAVEPGEPGGDDPAPARSTRR